MCGQPARCGLSLRSLRVPFSLRPVASRSFRSARSAPFRSARSVPRGIGGVGGKGWGVSPPSAPVFPCHLPTPRSVCSRLCSPLLRSARSQLATARSPIARSHCPLAIACSPSIARHRCPVRRCPVANAQSPMPCSPFPVRQSLGRRRLFAVARSPLPVVFAVVLQLLPSGASAPALGRTTHVRKAGRVSAGLQDTTRAARINACCGPRGRGRRRAPRHQDGGLCTHIYISFETCPKQKIQKRGVEISSSRSNTL